MVHWMMVNERVWKFWLEGFSVCPTCHISLFFYFLEKNSKCLISVLLITRFLSFSHPYLHSHSAFSSPHPPLFPFLPLSHNAHSNSISHICSLVLIIDDSYPCLIPLTVHLCLTFSLPFICTVPLCVLACAYVSKHVSDLPWGRLFFSSPQGAAFLPPYLCSLSVPPLSLSTFPPLCCLSLEGDWRVVVFPVG